MSTAGEPRPGGSLVVVATPIGNLGDLSPRALEVLVDAEVVFCEDTRHTGLLLERAGVRAQRLVSLHAHNEAARADEVRSLVAGGATVALVCDAGTPLVSDPGARLVRALIGAGAVVTAVPGPSAVLSALVTSGLLTDRFCFFGFLPRKGPERRARLLELGRAAMPCVVYEAPGRVRETLVEVAAACGDERAVAVCRELTKRYEEIWRGSAKEAVAHLDEVEPRGEFALVIDAAPSRSPDEIDLDEALSALFAAGLDHRQAVAAVVALFGVAHRVAYARALALRDAGRA